MAKKITITVPFDFKKGVTIETEGFAGQGCKNATGAFEKALGKVTGDTDTEEMFKVEQQQDQQQWQ